MNVVVTVGELREALKAVRLLGQLSGEVRFRAGNDLLIEGARFSVTVSCQTVRPGEGVIAARTFVALLRALPTFRDDRLEIALDKQNLRLGSFSLPAADLHDTEPSDVLGTDCEAPWLGTPTSRALAEAIRDGWNVWSAPERLDAVRVLGQALLDVDKSLARFGVEPDEVLALVARRVGASDVDRLRGLIQAVAKKHPWPQRE